MGTGSRVLAHFPARVFLRNCTLLAIMIAACNAFPSLGEVLRFGRSISAARAVLPLKSDGTKAPKGGRLGGRDRGRHNPPPQRQRSNRNRARSFHQSGSFHQTGSRVSAQPLTDTPEKDCTAMPRTGWPQNFAGSNCSVSSRFATAERVAGSSGPETMLKSYTWPESLM
jgi:hypothetical protein